MFQISEAERTRVEGLLRQRELPPRQRERLEMVKAASLGQDLQVIALWSGRTPRTIRHWLLHFKEGGPDALLDAPRSGRPLEADASYLEALDAALATTPKALGFPYDVWTSARLSAYLADKTGVTIVPSWLRTLLKRRDYTHGRPKHTLSHLQDPDATAACADLLAAVGKKGG